LTATRNLILGAGLAGLSAAYHLPARDTLVLEKEREVGGLCRSREMEGFVFDCTGHLLHLREGSIRDLVLALLPAAFRSVERRSLIFSKGVYTGYPFQANTHGLPTEVIRECVVGFVEALMRRERKPNEPDNFREWTLATFGAGIARHFMFPYNEKLYRIPLAELECGWVSWSIPRPTLDEVVRGALGSEVRGLGYNPRFLYPRTGGINAIPKALADRCGEIRLGCAVQRLDPTKRKVILETGEVVEYERLISTLPLDSLLRILSPARDPVLREAPDRLRAVKVINLNLGIDRAGVLPGQWVYYPEAGFPFYRVGSPSNYSDAVAPKGCSSLYVEVARRRDEHVVLEKLSDEVMAGLRRAGILRSSDRLLVQDVQVLDPAYVIHDHYRRDVLPGILQSLQDSGILSVGRFGAWEYGSMESALRQGQEAAFEMEAAEGRVAGGKS